MTSANQTRYHIGLGLGICELGRSLSLSTRRYVKDICVVCEGVWLGTGPFRVGEDTFFEYLSNFRVL